MLTRRLQFKVPAATSAIITNSACARGASAMAALCRPALVLRSRSWCGYPPGTICRRVSYAPPHAPPACALTAITAAGRQCVLEARRGLALDSARSRGWTLLMQGVRMPHVPAASHASLRQRTAYIIACWVISACKTTAAQQRSLRHGNTACSARASRSSLAPVNVHSRTCATQGSPSSAGDHSKASG